MSYEQFWNDCPELYYDYEEAHIEQLKEQDMLNWQQGIYFKLASASNMDKNVFYPKKPMFFGKEEAPRNAEEMRDKALGIVAMINATNKN